MKIHPSIIICLIIVTFSNGFAQDYGLTDRISNTSFLLNTDSDTLTTVSLRQVFSNLNFIHPVFLTSAHDGTDRIFVVEKGGTIKVFPNQDSVLSATTFLNITSEVNSSPNEAGLLSVAFHPDYSNNGKFYVYYTHGSLYSRISEFQVSNNPDIADSSSERILMEVQQPAGNHNGGQLMFGPDGYLYIGFGDGGGGGDTYQNGQDPTTLLGTILRIDVNSTTDSTEYGIPQDNPYIGNTDGWRPEIWSWGMRNPWRFSFDRSTGKLWVGDVGQNQWEEIDIVERGHNYGWNIMEGTHCYSPSTGCDTTGLTLPIFEYSHSVGHSITGGYVYRGSRLPGLYGTYIYGDYVDREIWGLRYENGAVVENTLLADSPNLVSSFGEDEAGEVYVVNYSGQIYTFDPPDTNTTPGNIPDTLSNAGLYTDMINQTVALGIIPYGVNSRLWSDGAYKTRYLALPGVTQIGFSENGFWQFPPNAVLVKNFYLEMERGNPDSRKIIETRFLVKRSTGDQWDGFSYEWNDAATDAYLLSGNDTKTFTITDSTAEGGSYQQTYYYPSRNDCKTCHTPAAGRVLGVRTSELNGQFQYGDVTDNQLRSLNHINVFTTDIGEDYTGFPQLPNPLDATKTLASRARSYLDANCAQCHRPGGPGRTNMDLRYSTQIQNTNLIHVPAELSDLGVTGADRIKPGYPDSSVLYLRTINTGDERMPPLATSLVDEPGTNVIRQWIEEMTNWKIRISVTAGDQSDADNYLGTSPDATTNFDSAYDEVEPPPPPGNSVQVYFPHPEWNNPLGDNFSSDIRPQINLTDTMQVWNFTVLSTTTEQVTLTFNFINFQSLPVIFGNTITGNHYAINDSDSFSFNALADSAYSFSISVGDTTPPQLALSNTIQGPRILRAGQQYTLQWNATDGDGIDSTALWFSDDQGATFQPIAKFGSNSTYNWTVPDVMLETQCKLRVIVDDYAGNSRQQTSTDLIAIAGDSLTTNVTAGWTLWGAPLAPEQDSMDINLGDDFPGYWVTYDYVNHGYTFDGILAPTAGYWLGTVNNGNVDVKGVPLTADTSVSLSSGWNLISDPLVLNISKDSLRFEKNGESHYWAGAQSAGWINTLYGYQSGGYSAVSTLNPWVGYWLSVLDSEITITYPIHQHQMNEKSTPARQIVEDSWGIAFYASTGQTFDSTTVVGAANDATEGFDNQYDAVKPPLPPGDNFVSLDLDHPEWNHPLGEYFARDIRSALSDGDSEIWRLTSRATTQNIQVTWQEFNVPESYQIGYRFSAGTDFANLNDVEQLMLDTTDTLWIKVDQNVLGTLNGVKIPTKFALYQNFPNPFNPATTIRFDLPKKSDVLIRVYNIAGQVIDVLTNQTMDAGYHSVVWNAVGVSSGIYYYRITASDFNQTRKCIVLK